MRTSKLVLSISIFALACGDPTVGPSVDGDGSSLLMSAPYDVTQDVIADVDFSDLGYFPVVSSVEGGGGTGTTGRTDPAPAVATTTTLDDHLASLPAGDTTSYEYVAVVRQTHADPPLAVDLANALAAGTLATPADFAALRASWRTGRVSAVSADRALASSDVTSTGASVVEASDGAFPWLAFTATKAQVESLIATGHFRTIGMPDDSVVPVSVDGGQLRATVGTAQFGDTGEDVDGDGSPEYFAGGSETIAMWDTAHIWNPEHYGLFSSPPSGGGSMPAGTRIGEEYDCTGWWTTECAPNSGPLELTIGELYDGAADGRQFHALHVASILIGDITNGQDLRFTTSAEREARSFVAREATVDTFASNYQNNAGRRRMEMGAAPFMRRLITQPPAARPSRWQRSS